MPVTLSYDLTNLNGNQRSYVRSALERFQWRHLGGSVFRYSGIDDGQGGTNEDWLNHVAPALMFFRSYMQKHAVGLTRFTLDAHSVTMLDHSDVDARYGHGVQDGQALNLAVPTNGQSSEAAIRGFVDGCSAAAP
ncbi:MAG: hypothetical protein ACRELB_04155 [Polyangiaceae bacterium]